MVSLVAFETIQLSVTLWPVVIEALDAVKLEMVGCPATVTVSDWLTVAPAELVAVSV
jgi:hypothetical protein